MPNYLSIAEFKARMDRQYAAMYDDNGAPNDDWITDDIEAAEGEIDAYLSKRYVTPVTAGANAALLRRWTRTIAGYLAHFRTPAQAVPEGVQTAYDMLVKQLQAVAAGKMNLGSAELPQERNDVDGAIIVEGNDPVMERIDMEGF